MARFLFLRQKRLEVENLELVYQCSLLTVVLQTLDFLSSDKTFCTSLMLLTSPNTVNNTPIMFLLIYQL